MNLIYASFDILTESLSEGMDSEGIETTIWQALAPFRLVEYSYVSHERIDFDCALFGFPDGTIYDVLGDIPENAITRLARHIAKSEAFRPLIFLYLHSPNKFSFHKVESFMRALSRHIGISMNGYVPDGYGEWNKRGFGIFGDTLPKIDASVSKSETDRLLPWDKLIETAGLSGPSSVHAWMTYGFRRYLLHFTDVCRRDDFIAWSIAFADAQASNEPEDTVPITNDFVQPAVISAFYPIDTTEIPVVAPKDWREGDAWLMDLRQDQSSSSARAYWHAVKEKLFQDATPRLPWTKTLRDKISARDCRIGDWPQNQ